MTGLHLSERLAGVGVSPILALSAKAGALKAAGRDVIDLTVGEPDFETPPAIRLAAMRAMEEGRTRYTPLAGTAELREAVAGRMLAAHGMPVSPDAVIACAGAKQVIHNAMAATLNPGDEVVLPTPFWSSYADIVRLEAGRPVTAAGRWDRDRGWRLDVDAVEAAITPRTRWLFLNAPGNPAGSTLDDFEMTALAAMLERHPHVWVLSDDIYEDIIFDGPKRPTLAAAFPYLAKRTLIVSGVSKAYAMTGWRLGWGVGPVALIRGMIAIQSQTTSAPCSISQAAAVAALTGPQACVTQMVQAFRGRRDYVQGRLSRLAGVECPSPEGAFYLFPRILGLEDDVDLCERLLATAGVAVVPGSAFGTPGHLRISFAAAIESLRTACDRIEVVLSDPGLRTGAAA